MADTIYLTQDGLDSLNEELKGFKSRRKEVVKRIREAKEFGDLSENSEYDDAKNEQALVEGRIAEIEDVLRKAKVVSAKNSAGHLAALGRHVVIELDGEAETYSLVGATEANPLKGKISIDSPLGMALLGHGKGETISVHTPSGVTSYKINDVLF